MADVSQQRQDPPPGPRPPFARTHHTTDAAARGGLLPALQSPKSSPLRCLSERPYKQARPKSASSAEAPLQAPGRPSLVQTTPPTPLLEGAFLVAIWADPRASNPQELLVAVP